MSENKDKLTVLLITGLSGAGKSTALSVLEDLDYEAIDNLPVNLLPGLIELAEKNDPVHKKTALAVCIDARTRNFQQENIISTLRDIKNSGSVNLNFLYFDCSDEKLVSRFTETRRRHPLAKDRPVIDGIVRERQLLEIIKAESDYLFDTTELNIHDLKRLLSGQFKRKTSEGLNITVYSFGYPKGLPRDADLVLDMRFLKNPHYDENLRRKTGMDGDVGEYIMSDPVFENSWDKVSSMILTLLPEYKREGKSYLTIAFGCTGGKHRSVFMAERMAKLLTDMGNNVSLMHRELS
ncbi:RNase adapter RapZ [Pseudemcibacter aquimaris]|uniref:RNase adapter RapZ n=1 Tax=Pseudemcibacter aquimaris TaxID=2857064 RepID=UPI002010E027|nr:RNase adapter RapZ [Pseudemcibacter aquimaris]MCC3860277.1 RNase adapter RapZ [Pseudemcibacter aquimaris]WDU57602.1 RNase adapter RapZ [Pseudemcibacter aquimaris]